MIDWKLKEEGFDKEKISYLGNKFLTGNGYMGVRGTLGKSRSHQPCRYL